MQDAVRINVESNLNLRGATRGQGDAIKMEGSEVLVVAREWTFTLQHFDFHARLVVAVSGKDLRLPGWDCRVARDHGRRNAACRFDRKRQRSHVKEQDVFHVTLEDAALDGRANRYDFVG